LVFIIFDPEISRGYEKKNQNLNFDMQILRFVVLSIMLFIWSINSSVIKGSDHDIAPGKSSGSGKTISSAQPDESTEQLNNKLYTYLKINDLKSSKPLAEILRRKVDASTVNDNSLILSHYLLGIFYLKSKITSESVIFLNSYISLKESIKERDETYCRAFYNLSLAYFDLGNLKQYEKYSLKSLEAGKAVYGENSPKLENAYLTVLTAYVVLNEYEKAIDYSDVAFTIANNNPDKVEPIILLGIYVNVGVCYARLGNFSKAKIYYDKGESMYSQYNIIRDYNYINLLDVQASVLRSMKMNDEAEGYYKKGLPLAIASDSPLAFNFINNYCFFLAKYKKVAQGEKLLKEALSRAKTVFSGKPNDYCEVLYFYASYLLEYNLDIKKSIEYFENCLDYVSRNEEDLPMKYLVYSGYSRALKAAGDPQLALEKVQSLLLTGLGKASYGSTYNNPTAEQLKPDINTLKILKLKYDLLLDIYNKRKDITTLEAASSTSELIIALLDKVRINISEDQSRLILGDKYRDLYLNAIRDFNQLYSHSGDKQYLDKAFEYSEKSKVAGLLTSTRELKATQFHIPAAIAGMELDLQREIGILNDRISEESVKKDADPALIANFKEHLLETTRKRDSLILVFEKKYPDYFALKYNTRVQKINEVPGITGRNGNYISYILSDTMLYTFVVNRKYQRLIATTVDSSFINDIKRFRSLLSMPSPSDKAGRKFREYQEIGYRLYKRLIEPVKSSFISGKLFISPDNILSYIPFEALPQSTVINGNIRYADLNYLMDDYDISYAYSATFLSETTQKGIQWNTSLVAFAPDYPDPIDVNSALMSRQAGIGVLNDLPFARQEAKYITDITGGTLYENSSAKESIFKAESGKYDIIHLAMHTLLNDVDPMMSTLIFSKLKDSLNDGYLKTYEVYGVPLKARMVVLSSCNTGTGILFSGEGILSLARGFIYAGSQSVVMSLWEIEDKSGTLIVEKFYKNLKSGYSKSIALKKARRDFLKDADQLRSHPYFWSTLVIYGNNEPLYRHSVLRIILVAGGLILMLALGYYFSKRKYS
jgi:CHAT domain-containing protein